MHVSWETWLVSQGHIGLDLACWLVQCTFQWQGFLSGCPPLDRRDYHDHDDRNLIQQVALRHLHLSKPLDLLRTWTCSIWVNLWTSTSTISTCTSAMVGINLWTLNMQHSRCGSTSIYEPSRSPLKVDNLCKWKEYTHLATHCWSTSSLFRVALTMEYVAITICDKENI